MMIKSISLRTRLFLLVLLATVVPAALLGLRFIEQRSADIDAGLQRLTMQANDIAHDLDERIQGTAQLQFGLARAVDLNNSDRASCSAFLSAVLEQHPQYTGILTIGADGRLFCDSLNTNRSLDLNDRAYFQKARATSETIALQVATGRLTGTSVLQIAYPARSETGALKFVLLASLNLQKFTNTQSIRLPRAVDVLLVDKDGVVRASPAHPNWVRKAATSTQTDNFRQAILQSGKGAQTVVDADGRQQIWAAAGPSANLDAGLFVMVGMPKDQLVAAADRRLYEDLGIVAIVALLLFAGVWTVAEISIRRQVCRIATMANRLGAGDLGIRIAAPYPGGELGRLMHELNAAADSLERQHTAIDALNRMLLHSQQTEANTKVFLDAIIEHIPHPISVKALRDPSNETSGWEFTLVNKAYEGLAGRPRDQIIGKSAYEIYESSTADVITASDDLALDLDSRVFTHEFSLDTRENGLRVLTSKRVSIRDETGKPRYLLSVLEDVTDRRLADQRISYIAHHDALTDLPNRVAFNVCFDATLAKAAAKRERFTILSLDLNRFKETNDVYGHAAGDLLLQEVAQRLQAIPGIGFMARIGGDEFILIITGGEHPAAASAVAHRLIAAFAEDFTIEGKRIQIGVSIGGAVYPDDGTDTGTLLIHADAALYRAKTEPRPAVVFFEAEMGAQLQERHNLQVDLKLAIERNELQLHYQPQFKMSGDVVGFEALARWHSPTRGMVPPSTFITIAEESSLILPLGEWALRDACREAASWPKPLTVAVNVSPIQFHHGDLPSLVHDILLTTGLAPARLVLEITEGVLISDFSRALSILRQLKALGVSIALDDFGTGYSSLSYLHSFPFDKIKIDRGFVADLVQSHHSRAIVRAVIGLGRSLDIPILAEGVETDAQRQFLAEAGCDEIQGYLPGRPYPIGHYADFIDVPVESGQHRRLGRVSGA